MTNSFSNTRASIQSHHQGRWLRVCTEDPATLEMIRKDTGADLTRASSASFAVENDFSYIPVTFIDESNGVYNAVRVIFAVGRDLVITLEPATAPVVLNTALTRMERDGRDSENTLEIVADIFQAIADGTDGMVGQLNDLTEKVMVETNAVLSSLEVKTREFGVSDVTSTQINLAEMEELLSRCMESQLDLVRAVRHLRTRVFTENPPLRIVYDTLIEDIEAIEQHVEFVHDRVRFLQQINNMALNVKQNQIVKVFSVITAVFLPTMLVTTFYSMNIEYMPILQWQYGEPVVMVLTFIFAILPLFYIKKRGWLR